MGSVFEEEGNLPCCFQGGVGLVRTGWVPYAQRTSWHGCNYCTIARKPKMEMISDSAVAL